MTDFSKKWSWKRVHKEKEVRRLLEQTFLVTQRLYIHNPNIQLRLQFINNSITLRFQTYVRSQ
jgi:hypothetical protein